MENLASQTHFRVSVVSLLPISVFGVAQTQTLLWTTSQLYNKRRPTYVRVRPLRVFQLLSWCFGNMLADFCFYFHFGVEHQETDCEFCCEMWAIRVTQEHNVWPGYALTDKGHCVDVALTQSRHSCPHALHVNDVNKYTDSCCFKLVRTLFAVTSIAKVINKKS